MALRFHEKLAEKWLNTYKISRTCEQNSHFQRNSLDKSIYLMVK